ncbi:MAG TPA: hypothetical protein V6C95_19835 [Coleofasciculaceae cyanobacterium]
MASKIYAIAHIGRLKLYVGDASCISSHWPSLLAMLNNGTYPNAAVQAEWNSIGGKRYFSFHTEQDLLGRQDIVGIEQLATESDSD